MSFNENANKWNDQELDQRENFKHKYQRMHCTSSATAWNNRRSEEIYLWHHENKKIQRIQYSESQTTIYLVSYSNIDDYILLFMFSFAENARRVL